MPLDRNQLESLRRTINENLRVQMGGADTVPYINVSTALGDIGSRQNHTVFGRRGCGKTLLLHQSKKGLPSDVRAIYLNCEDFKQHSFPNVLIEILDTIFEELQRECTGWFGRKRKLKQILSEIRAQLEKFKEQDDELREDIVETTAESESTGKKGGAGFSLKNFKLGMDGSKKNASSAEVARSYSVKSSKLSALNGWLPSLKRKIRDFFELSTSVKSIFIQIDDFYHLAQADQPDVMDYVHRLCKDLPMYFKVATLRHASTLYADRNGQPIGAQERHDYQPINIDYTFADFPRTKRQNHAIFHEFAKLAGLEPDDIDSLFKGDGFDRLIMAGGGVPRDCLSLFLEANDGLQGGDGRIGKDDVRIMSRTNFERRIEELKQDSDEEEEATLVRGIYVLRQFCLDRQTNLMMISEEMMQQEDQIRRLIYRLLDYRIIHSAGTGLTHKSVSGTYHAFAIDIGCYAHMRKLDGKFTEIDVSTAGAREKMRSSPILTIESFSELWNDSPENSTVALQAQEED